MLDLRNVCKSFSGIPAVDDVSFMAHAGEVTGYLGPNGSGKSTTMKIKFDHSPITNWSFVMINDLQAGNE